MLKMRFINNSAKNIIISVLMLLIINFNTNTKITIIINPIQKFIIYPPANIVLDPLLEISSFLKSTSNLTLSIVFLSAS